MSVSRTTMLPVLAVLAFGCDEAELEIPGLDQVTVGDNATLDSDGDGVSDEEEAALGTDPESDDTDLDGWTDGEELERNTDPVDGSDKPYEGGWPIGDCRDSVQADGSLSQGGIAPNFELIDTYGDTVALHDFCHMAVLVVTGAEWCGPCQAYRTDMAQHYDAYFARGLMVIDFLGENASGGEPTEEDLIRWADGHPYAVLGDPGWAVSNQGYVSGGIPAMSLLGPGAEVLSLNGAPPSGAQIEEALPVGFELPEYMSDDVGSDH